MLVGFLSQKSCQSAWRGRANELVRYQGKDRPRETARAVLYTALTSLLLFAEERLYFSSIFLTGVSFDEIDAMPGEHKSSTFGFYEDQMFAVSGSGVCALYITGLWVGQFVHFSQKRVSARKMDNHCKCHSLDSSILV